MDVALRCTGVAKTFAVQRELRVWRILLGIEGGQRGPVIEALRDISLEVPQGKIVGILGRNGAGKSTLLRLLGHVYAPTRGRIEVFGQVAGLFELGGMGNSNLTGREYAIRYLSLMGVQAADLATVFSESDVVSLHVSLTAETRLLANRSRLESLPTGAVLVNVSRGELVDEAALLVAVAAEPLRWPRISSRPGCRSRPRRRS